MQINYRKFSAWHFKYLFWRNLYKSQQFSFHGSWRLRKFIRRQFFENKYFKSPYLGHNIYVCPTHSMGKDVFEGGVYEPEILNVIQTFVSNGFSFIDIGANIGLHTLGAAFERKTDDQFFVSFEPLSEIFSILTKNCLENNLYFVECRQEGVGDKDGFSTLNVSLTQNQGNHSFLPREKTKPGPKVKVSTLDTLFLDNKKTDAKDILIKIDAEGYELPIIKGGLNWLSKIKNLAIICEISPRLMKENKMQESELYILTQNYGLTYHGSFKDVSKVTDESLNISSSPYNAFFYKGDLARKIASTIKFDI